MRLRSFYVENFKSFGEPTSFPLRTINLLYGPNSSGKSTLIQALLLLKQSSRAAGGVTDGGLELRGPLVDLGGYAAMVTGHDPDLPLRIGLEISGRFPSRGGFQFGERMAYVFEHRWSEADRTSRLASAAIIDGSSRRRIEFAEREAGGSLFLSSETASRFLLQKWLEGTDHRRSENEAPDPKDVSWVRGWLRKTPALRSGWLPAWSPRELASGRPGRPVGGSLSSPRRQLLQEVLFDWQNWAWETGFGIDQFLDDLRYIGPLREAPRRIHVEGGSVAEGMGVRGERAARLLARDPELLWRVNAALSMLEVPYEVVSEDLGAATIAPAIGELSALILRDRRTGVVVTPGDVGFGISQILPVVLQLLLASSTVVVIEQPEIHLHPRLQSRLADVIIASAMLRRNQIVVETHSEHLLLRLQRRIRGGSLSASDIQLLFVNREGARSVVTQVRLDAQGQLETAWPDGFFDERIEDLLADDEDRLGLDPRLGG